MAYVSDESGRREVYVRSLHGAARRVQVSSEGGDEPVWSPRGGEIFYRQGPRMIAVPVSTASGGVTLGTPAVLFEGRYDVDPFNNDATNYDVTGDGQRFIMVRPVADPGRYRQQLNVVVNWYEELTRLRGRQR
jgi:Tol biopolymer transport system component